MNNEAMGHLIAQLRKEHGLTQKQLADRLGVTDKAVSKWERGGGCPDISTLTPLAEVLEISVNELLAGEVNSGGSTETENSRITQNVLQYAEKVVSKKGIRLTKTLFAVISALFFIAVAVCVICDVAITRSFTWSPVPLTAIIYTWLIIAPLFYKKKNRVAGMLISASIFLLPFLYLLDLGVGRITEYAGWFRPVGVKLSVIGLILVWIFYAVFTVRKPINYWYRGAIAAIVTGVATVLIDVVLVMLEPLSLLKTLINIFTAVVAAGLLLFIGYRSANKREHS